MSDQPTDDEVLALANEIKAERGIPLTEAMILAEQKLLKPAGIDTEFTIHLDLKPKVAKFYRTEFGKHPEKSVEECMAIWITQLLQIQRGQALARFREDLEIVEGESRTVRRSAFLAQQPG